MQLYLAQFCFCTVRLSATILSWLLQIKKFPGQISKTVSKYNLKKKKYKSNNIKGN